MKRKSEKCNEDEYLPILDLLRMELRCKLQEKLQRVTVPYIIKDLKGNIHTRGEYKNGINIYLCLQNLKIINLQRK